jgi:DUF1680 family protein
MFRYNAGHLIEAALAHSDYYKNDLLLEPIVKYVSLIRKTFGPLDNQRHGYPGHPEIELALLRLYAATRNEDAYDLAKYFIEERGNPKGQNGMNYYDWEEKERGDSSWLRSDAYPQHHDHWYCQAHVPITEQKSVRGHSVRAMYLLTAVSDLVCLDAMGDHSLSSRDMWVTTLDRLWRNMVNKKMYITGGIGAVKQWEGFGIDYFLPQGTDEGGCYAETCASIAVMMLAERLLQFDLDNRYGDIMELCLYNGVMTSMSLDGKAFTYVNQLASSETDKSVREEWFWCACCPPNLIRLFGTLGGYLWDYGGTQGEAFVNVHLYTTAKAEFEVDGKPVVLEQASNWPWEGNVRFQLSVTEPLKTTIRLRIPSWSKGQYKLTPAPSAQNLSVEKGYLTLSPEYTASNPQFSINIGNFGPRYIASHPYTNGRTLTLTRGPIVYCMEDADNDWETNHFKDVGVKTDSAVHEERRVINGAEEYIALKTDCWQRTLATGVPKAFGDGPGTDPSIERFDIKQEAMFVPYYLRANRGGRGHMRVGLLEA